MEFIYLKNHKCCVKIQTVVFERKRTSIKSVYLAVQQNKENKSN